MQQIERRVNVHKPAVAAAAATTKNQKKKQNNKKIPAMNLSIY